MAEKIERTYNVPLRKFYQRAPKYRRTKRAVHALQDFLKRHMKSENIKIGKFLNEELWKNGIQNPPHHVKINVLKEEDVVYAELFGRPIETKKAKEEKKGLAEKLGLKKGKKEKKEEKPDEKTEEKKEEQKQEE